MFVGCYSAHLYCDKKNESHEYKEFPHEYTESTGPKCRRQARKDGWVFHKDGTNSCPKCNPKRNKK